MSLQDTQILAHSRVGSISPQAATSLSYMEWKLFEADHLLQEIAL